MRPLTMTAEREMYLLELCQASDRQRGSWRVGGLWWLACRRRTENRPYLLVRSRIHEDEEEIEKLYLGILTRSGV